MGTRNAISVVHLLRLQEVPLGPRNAFIEYVMATFDHPSDLFHHIAYPSLGRPGLRTDWPLPSIVGGGGKTVFCLFQPARSRSWRHISRKSNCIGEVTPAKSLGDSWSAGLRVGPLAGGGCHSAVSHGSAPQERIANDVVCAAGGRSFQRYEASSAHTRVHPNSISIPSPSPNDARSATGSSWHDGRSGRRNSWRSGRRSSRWSA